MRRHIEQPVAGDHAEPADAAGPVMPARLPGVEVNELHTRAPGHQEALRRTFAVTAVVRHRGPERRARIDPVFDLARVQVSADREIRALAGAALPNPHQAAPHEDIHRCVVGLRTLAPPQFPAPVRRVCDQIAGRTGIGQPAGHLLAGRLVDVRARGLSTICAEDHVRGHNQRRCAPDVALGRGGMRRLPHHVTGRRVETHHGVGGHIESPT